MCGGLTLTRVTFSTSSQPMVQENWEWWFWSVHHVLSLLILPSFSGEGLHTLALLQHGICPGETVLHGLSSVGSSHALHEIQVLLHCQLLVIL